MDANNKRHKDYAFARKICARLRSGEAESIGRAMNAVIGKFRAFFTYVIASKLSSVPDVEAQEVLSRYWKELMRGDAICKYHGKSDASLETWLLTRLNWRIKDAIARSEKENKRQRHFDSEPESGYTNEERMTIAVGPQVRTPEDDLIIKDISQIIHEALLMLSEKAPRDAAYIRMRFYEGLKYKEMALQRLAISKASKKPEDISRKTNAIKKRFTRPLTGSRAKFTKYLKRVMKQYGVREDDLKTFFALVEKD
ncbi:sigma-70 family RNA polymerase sigma factor [Desulfococcaceae bacterium HSG7]|nr:sigma-70 family RNA polymerase sigma factor [Desulfococcaceae bacterium HSG7]